jgi:hypothetical protein
MSATHHQLDGEPIVIVTYQADITAQDVQAASIRSSEIAQASPEALYWIVDLSQVQANFQDAIQAVTYVSRGSPGVTSGNAARTFLVGSHQLVRFFQDAMSQPQYGGLQLPLFRSLDDALAALRVKIQADRNLLKGEQ